MRTPPDRRSTADVGRAGEDLAVACLERAGMLVVARNWRCARGDVRGELDVVARCGPLLVFCEVKARRGAGRDPLVAVTPQKVLRLRRLAAAYLAERPHAGDVRFDVVAVSWPGRGDEPQVVHVPGVA